MSYFEHLNAPQQEAVEETDGPLLVLAGAGTGKTRVLTTRFAHIVFSGLAKPEQILTVTFTNKAANEMLGRIEKLIGPTTKKLWVGTFHAICGYIVREHAELIGLQKGFTVFDRTDQLRILTQIILAENLNPKEYTPDALSSIIQQLKEDCFLPYELSDEDIPHFGDADILAIYEYYQDALHDLNVCDFDDLIIYSVKIFQEFPEILAHYQDIFRYIMVDEYQDTNAIQNTWLRLLAQRPDGISNICCVGDDDQSIYAWRGAKIANILNFEKDFPQARIIRLECNYRSTAPILYAAAGLISHNDERLGKELYPALGSREDDEKITVRGFEDPQQEAQYIAQTAINLHHEGYSFSDMAILTRTNRLIWHFIQTLEDYHLPYHVVSNFRFYEQAEVRNALDYLRAILSPDNDLAFEFIIHTPRRSIDISTLQKIRNFSRDKECSYQRATRQLLTNGSISGSQAAQLSKLLSILKTARQILRNENPSEAASYILEDSGYLPSIENDPSKAAQRKFENIEKLLNSLDHFDTLASFLNHIDRTESLERLKEDKTTHENQINLMTMHASKGLEFKIVFLPAWNKGIFPFHKYLKPANHEELEEERRLAYVGMTRTQEKLFITYAKQQNIFLNELPPQFVTWHA